MWIWLALFLAIVMVLRVIQLRTLLAIRLDHAGWEQVADEVVVPPAWADLYAADRAQLAALGYSGPYWFRLHQGPPDGSTHLRAVFRSPDGEALLLGAPQLLEAPHLLYMCAVSRLQDGQWVSTLRHEWALPLLSPVRGSLHNSASTTLEQLLTDHRANRAAHAAALDPLPAEPSQLLDALEAMEAELLDDAAQRGLLVRGARGALQASWSLALRLLGAMRRRPRPLPSAQAVPPERMAHFARLQRELQSFAPPKDRQWTLFGVSVALFAIAGSLLLDPVFALTLLVVILIHELGHFLAMRLCGYRNLQMLALPLVGGVALGQELRPDPAHRAWIALMGPVPGILIGLFLFFGDAWFALPSWAHSAAWVFLAVNLLNLLPFPPLDGSAVLQALVGRRALGAAAWVTLLGGLLGVLVSWWLQLYVLMAVIGFQLLTLPYRFQLATLARQLRAEGAIPPAELTTDARLTALLRALDARLGTVHQVGPRLQMAQAILDEARTPLLPRLQRVLIGICFAAALLVPALSLLLPIWAMRQQVDRLASQSSELMTWMQQSHQILERQAAQLDPSALLDMLDSAPAPPASAAELAATQTRLGQQWTEDLRQLYLQRDGVAELGLARLKDLRTGVELGEWGVDWEGEQTDPGRPRQVDPIWFTPDNGGAEVSVPRAALQAMLELGGDEAMLRYDAGQPPLHPGLRFYTIDGTAHADLRSWIAPHWVARQQAAQMQQRRNQLARGRMDGLRELDVVTLAQRLQPELPWALRQLANVPTPETPAGASENQLRAAEQRLELSLPADLRSLLSTQDGWTQPPMLASHQLVYSQPGSPQRRHFLGKLSCPTAVDGRCPAATLESGQLSECVVLAGRVAGDQLQPQLLWCPRMAGAPVINAARQRFADLHEYLRFQVAQREVGF